MEAQRVSTAAHPRAGNPHRGTRPLPAQPDPYFRQSVVRFGDATALQWQRDQGHGVHPAQDVCPERPRFHAGAHGRGPEQHGQPNGLTRAQNAGPRVEVKPSRRPFPEDQDVVVLGRALLFLLPTVAHGHLAAVFHRHHVPTLPVHRDRHDRSRGFRAPDRTAADLKFEISERIERVSGGE